MIAIRFISAAARSLVILPAASLLAGCAQIDPMTTDLRWNASGVNDANLVVQVANPNDLVAGQSVADVDGELAAAAVSRLRHDQVKPLPDENGAPTASASPPPASASPSVGGS